MTAIIMNDWIDVEYVGDPNPLDEVMRMKIALGQIPASAANVIRVAAMKRSKAIRKVNIRIVDQPTFGTSQQYVFGPLEFIQKMKREDYLKVKETTSAHQFRWVDDPMNKYILPRGGEANIVFVDTTEYGVGDIPKLQQSIRGRG